MFLFHPGDEMKLRNKSLIAIGSVAITFLLLAFLYFETIGYSYFRLFVLASLAFLIIGFFFIMEVIKNIEELNDTVNNVIRKKNYNQIVPMHGKDEIAEISTEINQLLGTIQKESVDASYHLKDNEELKKENLKLQQKLSERHLLNDKTDVRECLSRLARYDHLTSLPNKVFFNEILNKAISHTLRHKKTLAILLISIDDFTTISKQLGELNSSIILKELGKRFASILRAEDILAKLDGDEFIILLNDINQPKFAGKVADKILNACSQSITINSFEYVMTSCIGISICPHDGKSLETLLKNMNNALFKAKMTGKGLYQFYTHEMSVEAREYIQLESALRKATHSNELVLYYQPRFRIKKGTITGVEALMRWEHPVLGLISPSTFVPHAEETGFIIELGEWALQEACQKIKFWQDEGYEHISVALKLSAKQFYHPDLLAHIGKAIKSANINPEYLELEIDEKTIMTNIDESKLILDKIKAQGVQLTIDHFGIGYTSINYLKKFAISSIKIDQSFIKGIPSKPDDMAIVGAIIALAHNLGLEVIAEGVETAEQVEFLTSLQCDLMQGYFLGNPVPAEKVILQFTKLIDEVYL
jgi:diguanylate cyclase (GGDEF)-like protein